MCPLIIAVTHTCCHAHRPETHLLRTQSNRSIHMCTTFSEFTTAWFDALDKSRRFNTRLCTPSSSLCRQHNQDSINSISVQTTDSHHKHTYAHLSSSFHIENITFIHNRYVKVLIQSYKTYSAKLKSPPTDDQSKCNRKSVLLLWSVRLWHWFNLLLQGGEDKTQPKVH